MPEADCTGVETHLSGPQMLPGVLLRTQSPMVTMQRFLHMVDQVLPRRGDTLQLPFNDPNLDKEATTNGREAQNEGQDIRKER